MEASVAKTMTKLEKRSDESLNCDPRTDMNFLEEISNLKNRLCNLHNVMCWQPTTEEGKTADTWKLEEPPLWVTVTENHR